MRPALSQALLGLAIFPLALAAQEVPTPTSEAAPFGLRMGMPKGDVASEFEEIAPFTFKIATVPKPHADFDFYVVKITPSQGLCFIKAIGKDVSTSVFGEGIRTQFSKITEQMSTNYGPPDVTDLLFPGSIWDEPDDWTMALLKEERVLLAKWPRKKATIKPPLKELYVGAGALSTDKGYVSIEYHFNNKDSCDKEATKSEASVL